MTPEEMQKAQERRERHRAQLRSALPAEFSMKPAQPVNPFAPMGRPQQAPWTIGDSFTPRGLAAAAGEGARFFGDEVFRPIGNAVSRGANAVADNVGAWNANRMERDRAEADLSARYMPQIRAANERTAATMAEYGDRSRQMEKRVGELEAGNRYIGGRLDAARYDGAPTFTPVDQMSDDELLAELQDGGFR